jgi:spore germination protein GerM
MRRFPGLGLTALLALALVGCGIGGDDHLRQISRDDLQGLDETTTTSTSTTTTTVAPTSPVGSAIGATSTTIATESVQLYFLDDNQLQPVTIDVAASASLSRVLAALLSGPPAGDLGIGLRSVLPVATETVPSLVNAVVPSSAGYATVDLNNVGFQLIDPTDQRAAIAQIVLTLTTRPGIGQVRFTLDGNPMRVPRREGLQSEPGELVSAQDYASLLIPVATTTTTAPPPVAPPAVTPAPTTVPG